jgi:S1-C subfamily serine protease
LKILDIDWTAISKLIPAKIISINSKIRIWQFVIAIWNALAEFENTVTFWIISGKNRKLNELKYSTNNIYAWLYQTDATINHGNSWWPLLDINGNVIGLNTAISSEWQWIWFSIPINKEFIQTTMDIIKTNWKILRPYIGIDYLELNKSIAKNMNLPKFEWLYIESISKDSPFKWQVKKWDIIVSINGENINNESPFIYTLFTFQPEEIVNFVIYSEKKYNKIKIPLGKIGE